MAAECTLADLQERVNPEVEALDVGVDDYDRPPDSAYIDDLLADQEYDTSLFNSSITTAPSADASMHTARHQEPLEGEIIVNRPVIQLEGGQLHNYAESAEAVLAEDIYVRGGKLVRLGTVAELRKQSTGPDPRRDHRQAVIVLANQYYLRRELTRRADFQSYRRREQAWVSVDCPTMLAANIVNVAESPYWRPLTAIARAPFLRPDLSVCEHPGYDAATGIYYEPSSSFPSIPASPSKAEAEHALAYLRAPFDQFPFQTPASESVFVAHILTAVMRAAVPTSPAFFYTAPSVAHGKTLLCKAANVIAAGNMPAIRPYTDNSEEMRKVLFGALLAGDAGLLFDNVPNGIKVRSSVLCAFSTAEVYGDRQLGASDSTSLLNTLLVALTGNNLTPAGDLARRSLVCRLDANAESARGRQFKIEDLAGYVLEHRAELLVAAITVIRAYVVADQPRVQGTDPLESFETWTRVARDPLVWLGMADPVATQELETEDDHDTLCAAFTAIEASFRTQQFTSRKIAGLMGPEAVQVRAALETAGCSNADDSAKVGYWLRANRDVVAGRWKLISHKGHAGIAVWQLKEM